MRSPQIVDATVKALASNFTSKTICDHDEVVKTIRVEVRE
jgi:hypothetical protein